MNIKTWQLVASALVATLTLLALLGFNSPASAVSKLEFRVSSVERLQAEQAVINAEVKKDLSYIADGVDELRGVPRRNRRRSIP